MSTGSTKTTLTDVSFTTILTMLEGLIAMTYDSSITDQVTQDEIKNNIDIIRQELDIIRLDTTIPIGIQSHLNKIKDQAGKAAYLKSKGVKRSLKDFILRISGYIDTFNTTPVTTILYEIAQLKVQSSPAGIQTKINLILK